MPGETFTPLLKISVEFGFCDFAGQIGDKPVGAFDPFFAAVSGKKRMACYFEKNDDGLPGFIPCGEKTEGRRRDARNLTSDIDAIIMLSW
jgi:hypothetical protein